MWLHVNIRLIVAMYPQILTVSKSLGLTRVIVQQLI